MVCEETVHLSDHQFKSFAGLEGRPRLASPLLPLWHHIRGTSQSALGLRRGRRRRPAAHSCSSQYCCLRWLCLMTAVYSGINRRCCDRLGRHRNVSMSKGKPKNNDKSSLRQQEAMTPQYPQLIRTDQSESSAVGKRTWSAFSIAAANIAKSSSSFIQGWKSSELCCVCCCRWLGRITLLRQKKFLFRRTVENDLW